jgi:hypothetical protein
MTKSETIKIQDGDIVIELTGADKDNFIAQREADNVAMQLVKTANATAKAALLAKLGITAEEATLLLS